MIAGVDLSSHFDARHVEKGDQPHSAFYVVWQPGEAGEPFGYSTLDDLSRIKTLAPARSFIMEQPSGRIGHDEFDGISYKVLSSGESEQLIEVVRADGDYGAWSRYRATRSGVAPVYARVMNRRYLFMALLPALGLAAAIYAIGRWLRRRVARAKAESDASSNIVPSG